MRMDAPNKEFVLAGSLEELKAKGRLVVHGGHRPILVIYDRGRVFALDNRCPHMGFPLERGTVEDGILTCHWHQRLADGLAHDLGLVIAKAIHGQVVADVRLADIVRQVVLFGTQNRDGWGVGLTILTALANQERRGLPAQPDGEGEGRAVLPRPRADGADTDAAKRA
jgi:Rieske [2Fe-2S] domain